MGSTVPTRTAREAPEEDEEIKKKDPTSPFASDFEREEDAMATDSTDETHTLEKQKERTEDGINESEIQNSFSSYFTSSSSSPEVGKRTMGEHRDSMERGEENNPNEPTQSVTTQNETLLDDSEKIDATPFHFGNRGQETSQKDNQNEISMDITLQQDEKESCEDSPAADRFVNITSLLDMRQDGNSLNEILDSMRCGGEEAKARNDDDKRDKKKETTTSDKNKTTSPHSAKCDADTADLCTDDVEEEISHVWEEYVNTCLLSLEETRGEDKDAYLGNIKDSSRTEDTQYIIEDATDAAVEATESIMGKLIESLFRHGLGAFHDLESVARDVSSLWDLAETRGKELQRLQDSEASSRDAVSNLLRAVETAKGERRESARAAQMESRLRGEIASLRSERDGALSDCAEAKRKLTVLEEEIRLVRLRLGRVTQEKVKVERDSRAAMSLARSLDSHTTSDVEFYKRKVTELNEKIQIQQANATEQRVQMEEMKRQLERNMSLNRLAQIRRRRTDGVVSNAVALDKASAGSEAGSNSRRRRTSY